MRSADDRAYTEFAAAPTAARAVETVPATAVLARMMRLGWGIYYQAQAELRAQLAAVGWDEADIAAAVSDLAQAERQAILRDGPPSLADLDVTLTEFGRGLVSALASAAAKTAEG